MAVLPYGCRDGRLPALSARCVVVILGAATNRGWGALPETSGEQSSADTTAAPPREVPFPVTAATALSILEKLAPLALMASLRDAAGEIVDFRYEYVNPALAEVLHEQVENLVGRRLLERYPSHVELGIFDKFRAVVDTGEPYVAELPWIDERNVRGFLEVRAVRYGDGYLVTGRDITEEKRARLAHEIVAATTDVVIATDAELRVTAWNPAAERLYGYRSDDVTGRPAWFVAASDSVDEHRDRLREALAGARVAPFETFAERGDGSRVDVEITVAPVRADGDPVVGVVAVHRDISERLQARRALLAAQREVQETASLLQAMIDTSPDLLMAYAADGRALQMNRAAVEHTGVARDAMLGRSIREVLPDYGERFDRLAHEAVTTGEPVRDEVEFCTGDGEPRWYEDLFAPEMVAGRPTGRIVTASRDVTDRHFSELELASAAYRDPLTGLLNRRLLLDRIRHDVARLERGGASLAVLFIDLDGFKEVNDRLGHDTGDEVLRAVGRRLAATTRHGDTVARTGGDEFVVVSNEESGGDAAVTAQRILGVLGAPIDVGGEQVRVGASIGIVVVDDPAADAERIVADADVAMYRAKQVPGDRYEFFDGALRDEIHRREAAQKRLRAALDGGEIEPWFQPEIDLRSGRVVGLELLSRWRHRDGTVASAGEFMPTAESSGLVSALDREMRRRAFAHMAEWRHTHHRTPTLWLNVASREITADGYAGEFLESVASAGLDPDDVGLDLPETLVLSRTPTVVANCAVLSDAGVRLAVDDFGTGEASLACLRDLRVDTLKVDRSFVAGLAENPFDDAVVVATVALGASLGMRVVGEGVETVAQRDALVRAGCGGAQGEFFAEPQPPDRIAAVLAAGPSVSPAPSPSPAPGPEGA